MNKVENNVIPEKKKEKLLWKGRSHSKKKKKIIMRIG